jgi:small subunit ribosomal protein S1
MADVSEAQGSSEPNHELGDATAPAAAPETPVHIPQAASEAAEPEAASPGDPPPEGAEATAAEAAEGEGASDGEDAGPEGAAAEAGAEGTGKRKRRRRRKGKSAAGTEDAPSSEVAEARARRAALAAPFLRFFVGPNAGRKHGFAVGEVVAGRVKSVEDGAITVDLFGKALAYADENEPREVPPEPQPEPPPPLAAKPSAESAPASAPADSTAAEAVTLVSAPAPEGAASEATESGSEAEGAPDAAAAAAAAAADLEHAAAAEAMALEAAESEAEAELDETSAGEIDAESAADAPHAARGPLPPAPIVPDELPRAEPVQLGQVFRGRVGAIAESGHIAIVNRIIDRKAVRANAERYRNERRRVLGLVFGFNRGGFDVLVEGVRAFCPASAMSLEEIVDPHAVVGQRLEFLLPTAQNTAKDLIVSRRSILERLYRKKARELMRSLQPGQKIKGRVTAVREFGLFVDIGGIEGLVHQSELSFAHGVRPADVAKPGDEVEVQVLRVGGDPNRGNDQRRDRVDRIGLSMKALQPDPWDQHGDVLHEGSVVNGKVKSTTDFGAFIELVPQVEGLLHITELGRDLKHADQVVKEGDEIPVVIERIDRRSRRISLSKLTAEEAAEIQQMKDAGQELQAVRPGARVKVKVARVEPQGLLVRVSGVVGRRGRGYVPARELVKQGDLRKQFAIGSELEVKIVGIDRDGGLRCSPKALEIDDERRAVKDYRREASRQGFGTFGDLLRAKIGGQEETK